MLRSEVHAGRLDGDAVEAVLACRRPPSAAAAATRWAVSPHASWRCCGYWPVGCSNKQIAHELQITRKTVGNHVEHIYTKLGVTNRALASLFAAQHGLFD